MVGEHGRVGRTGPGGAQDRRRLPTIAERDRRLGFSRLGIDAFGLRVRRRVAISHAADIGLIRRRQGWSIPRWRVRVRSAGCAWESPVSFPAGNQRPLLVEISWTRISRIV